MNEDRILNRLEVCDLLGIGETTFKTQSAQKGFPKPFRWGEKTEARWLYSDVIKFIKKQTNEGGAE